MSTAEYYRTYWTDAGFNPTGSLPADLERLYRTRVAPTDDVLDVGCGDGRTSGPFLSGHAGSYTGADISETAVETARSAELDAVLIDDAGTLPFGDASFDVVTSIEVYEHLFDPHLAAAEALRVLRPGGRLILTVPNLGHWKQRLDLALRARWNPLGDELSVDEPWRDPHIRFYTPEILSRMLEQAGFEPVEVGGRRGSIVQNVKPLSRFARHRPGPVGRWMLERAGGVLGAGLYAVAHKPA
jgi:SAM-dependent methyltransferase